MTRRFDRRSGSPGKDEGSDSVGQSRRKRTIKNDAITLSDKKDTVKRQIVKSLSEVRR